MRSDATTRPLPCARACRAKLRPVRRLLLFVLVLAGCHREPPRWPEGLTRDVRQITVKQGGAEARLARDASGLWRASAPHHGEGDPRAINSLLDVLAHPQLAGTPERSGPRGPVRTRIELEGPAGTHVIEVEQAALQQPVPLVLDGKERFPGAPLELSTKIPAPDEYVANALWMSAEHKETTLTVTGRAHYTVKRTGPESWVSDPPARPGPIELEDFPGAITGRQVVGFPPPGPPEKYGLDHPALTAVLCAGATCRTFRFGEKVVNGQVYAYAQAPDMDLAEIRDDVWRLLLRGP